MFVVREPTNVLHNKNSDAVTTSLKAILLIFVIASISMVSLSALRHRPPPLSTTNIVQLPHRVQPPRSSPPPPTNISHIIFGIGGSFRTWPDRRRYAEIWWQPNIKRGYVWLDNPLDPVLFSHPNSPPYRVSNSLTRLKHSGSSSAIRIASIVVEAFKLGLPDARWFMMGDDDTVFFGDNVVTLLSKYDHRRMYYVGGLSESLEQDVMHSYEMAFGSGGFTVSYLLAVKLVKVFGGCLDRYAYFYGSDQRVWACVTEICISLTKECGFHQDFINRS